MPGAEGFPEAIDQNTIVPNAVEGVDNLLAETEEDMGGKLKKMANID